MRNFASQARISLGNKFTVFTLHENSFGNLVSALSQV